MDQTKVRSGKPCLITAMILFIGAIVTLIPFSNIDDSCFLGYKALCAFTPISTIILIAAGIVVLIIRSKRMKSA